MPTMGFLHEGHLSLIRRSVAENEKTVVSIFVNPTQFSPGEDLEKYPRNLERDLELCRGAGADLVFCPGADEIYQPGACTFVDLTSLTGELCGKTRPNYFRGVATVVTKLLCIVTPEHAYFGQKDAQQLAVVEQVVRDLDIDTRIVGCPTVREADGLAKSSRNSYLSPEQRAAAVVVSAAVFEGERLVKSGERQAEKVRVAMRDVISRQSLAKAEYIEIVDGGSIRKIERLSGRVLGAVAVIIGSTRLIDNFTVNIPE